MTITTTLMPEGRQRYFNNDGSPAAGCKLYTYAAGTTTPKDAYTDSVGTIAHANPITLDAKGEAVIFWSGAYKVDLKTATGVQITGYPIDNMKTDPAGIWTVFTTFMASAGASLMGFIQSGAGAVAQTVQTVLRYRTYATQYGADATGATDSSAAIVAAIAKLGSYGTLDLPEGTFAFNVDFGTKRINVRGAGSGMTTIKSFTSGGYPITFSGNSSWDLLEISDVTITGGGTYRDGGVQYGQTVYATNNQYAGRVIYSRVKFTNLNKAVHKRFGNIGNQFHQCTFDDNNYHWYAVGTVSPLMHAGADGFFGCHFSAAQLAVAYCDSPVGGSGGLYFDPECIIEANPGFILFVKAFNGVWVPGIVMDGCWNEDNASAATVTINSISYTTRDFYLNTARQVALKNMRITGMQLVNSVVTADRCNLDDLDLVRDADSVLISDRQFADTSQNTDFYAASMINSIRPTSGAMSVFSTRPRMKLTRGITALDAETYGNGPVNFGGAVTIVGAVVADGVLFDSCNEYALSADQLGSGGTCTLSANRYYVSSIDAKLVSGDPPTVDVAFNSYAMPPFVVSNTAWKTFVSITTTIGGTAASVRPRILGSADGSCVLRLSCYQVVEFTELQDAVAFADSLLYAGPLTIPRTIYGTEFPTTGTWRVGDRCINSDPAVGDPKAWTCSVAGTSGTWTSEGNL